MIRVNVVAEGQTEMNFARKMLNRFFNGSLAIYSRCVITGYDKQNNRKYRGGMTTYEKAKNDIVRWIKEDPGAYVTTMFDFFHLPNTFPGYQDAMKQAKSLDKVKILEERLHEDIVHSLPNISPCRFIPYIQLHEFEALLYTDIRYLKGDYLDLDSQKSIDLLYIETKDIPPEEINHGDETSPSKRLLKAIPYQKGDVPVAWMDAVTIPKVQERCPHFSEWIQRLQHLRQL